MAHHGGPTGRPNGPPPHSLLPRTSLLAHPILCPTCLLARVPPHLTSARISPPTPPHIRTPPGTKNLTKKKIGFLTSVPSKVVRSGPKPGRTSTGPNRHHLWISYGSLWITSFAAAGGRSTGPVRNHFGPPADHLVTNARRATAHERSGLHPHQRFPNMDLPLGHHIQLNY